MAIESHTVHHYFLPDSLLEAELVESEKAILIHLGVVARFIAYRYGGCNTRVMKATIAPAYWGAVGKIPNLGKFERVLEGRRSRG